MYENGVLKPTQPLSLAEQQVVQISLNPEATTDHPHITKTPGVCGGRPDKSSSSSGFQEQRSLKNSPSTTSNTNTASKE